MLRNTSDLFARRFTCFLHKPYVSAIELFFAEHYIKSRLREWLSRRFWNLPKKIPAGISITNPRRNQKEPGDIIYEDTGNTFQTFLHFASRICRRLCSRCHDRSGHAGGAQAAARCQCDLICIRWLVRHSLLFYKALLPAPAPEPQLNFSPLILFRG